MAIISSYHIIKSQPAAMLAQPLQTLQRIRLVPVLLLFFFSVQAQHADINLLEHINNPDVTSGTFKSMRLLSNSAGVVVVGVPVATFVMGVVEHDGNMKKKAVYMVESIALAQLATGGLKIVVNRPRPYLTNPGIIQKTAVNSSSFPSGHTSLAFAAATSLSIACPRWYVIAPSLTYAGLVGYSRMYLGVHYPSDVLAGAILGSGSAWATYELNRWLHQTRHKKLSTAW